MAAASLMHTTAELSRTYYGRQATLLREKYAAARVRISWAPQQNAHLIRLITVSVIDTPIIYASFILDAQPFLTAPLVFPTAAFSIYRSIIFDTSRCTFYQTPKYIHHQYIVATTNEKHDAMPTHLIAIACFYHLPRLNVASARHHTTHHSQY